MHVHISGTGHFLPGDPIHNDDLPKELETSDEWIYSHTGIHYRHLVEPGTACSDLAYQASTQALKEAGISGKDLDLILVSTVTPDYIGFPSVSAILQEKLKASHAGAMDVNAACSGFVYAMETAYSFIKSGRYKRILVIGSEVLSHISDWTDRSTCVLFGDGAGAAVLEASEEGTPWFSSLRALGSGAEALIRETGGSRNPLKPGDSLERNHFLAMNGQQVYLFAVKRMGQIIQDLLKQSELTIDDIDYIIPHQANVRIIEAVGSRSKIPMDKFLLTLDHTGNTSSASIPITLDEMVKKGTIQRGQRLILVGFGAGLTYAGTLLEW